MEIGLRAPLEGISLEQLNHEFAAHKMTIGQIAVHSMAWPQYLLSDEPPWEEVVDTCMPCEYPLTIDFVDGVVTGGCATMRDTLRDLNDGLLEVDAMGRRGFGYLLCRLQHHTMVHANQMAYLRSMLDAEWDFGSHFGDMATAYIRMPYHTEKDVRVRGF
jgi:hypothetical protein